MSTEDNKALARRGFEETLNQRNLTVLDAPHVPDFVYHAASRMIQGREPFKQFMSMLLTAFPDLHFSIEDVIGEGDKVVVRFTGRGTHQGDFMGIPPTG
jgi:predicted ester cyclase